LRHRAVPGKLPLVRPARLKAKYSICCVTGLMAVSVPAGSCPRPPSVPFARISPEDQMQNFYAVNTTVRYICRLGFENTTDQPPTSTCLDNLTWTKVPELCQTGTLPSAGVSP
uniref:Sushi domain-containing protein n=1 Tax=Malurus cyaneus samueli TaxID=2593467 RepID=A0A8C5TW12_9PASS